MQRYSSADISNKKWHQLMMHRAEPPCALQCCGVCLVCHRARMAQKASATLRLHAFELQPSNERMLRQLVALTGAPVEVHGSAVSNATGIVYTRDSGAPGYESVSAMRAPRGKRASTVLPRNVTTVDAFLASRRIERVSLVSIDTEGWDAFVMYGMANSLRMRRIDAFEFEYTRAWKPHFGERALADHCAGSTVLATLAFGRAIVARSRRPTWGAGATNSMRGSAIDGATWFAHGAMILSALCVRRVRTSPRKAGGSDLEERTGRESVNTNICRRARPDVTESSVPRLLVCCGLGLGGAHFARAGAWSPIAPEMRLEAMSFWCQRLKYFGCCHDS